MFREYICPFSRVMDDLTVKLTDCALTRDLFPQDYDCLPTDITNESRPLKFMAIESIKDRRFSTASDVVCIFILFTSMLSTSFYHLLVVVRSFTLGIDESLFTTLFRYWTREFGNSSRKRSSSYTTNELSRYFVSFIH